MNNKSKTVLLIVGIPLLVICITILTLVILASGRSSSVDESKIEKEFIEYLGNIYPESKFEIIELSDISQGYSSGFQIDGTYLTQGHYIEGKYTYTYTVKSIIDNVDFTVAVHIDYNEITDIDETYGIYKVLKTIEHYIANSNVLTNITKTEIKHNSFNKESKRDTLEKEINFYINENFDSFITASKIDEFSNFSKQINERFHSISNKYLTLSINIYDNTGKKIRCFFTTYNSGPYVLKNATGSYYDENGKFICYLIDYFTKVKNQDIKE